MARQKAATLYADHPQADLIDKVVAARSDDKSWSDIADDLKMGQGRAMYLYMIGTTDEADVIDPENAKTFAKEIVQARDKQGQSWGQISARTLGKTGEGKIRSLYEATSGKSASDSTIGKGGRVAGAEAAPRKAAAGKKAAPAKAAASKKSVTPPAEEGKKLLKNMNLAELQARLNGAKIQDDKGKMVEVKSVASLKDGNMVFENATTGKRETIAVKNIKKAGRPAA